MKAKRSGKTRRTVSKTKLQPVIALLFLGIFGFNCTIWAQPQKSLHNVSAEQAVNLALQHRTELLNARIDLKNQEAYNKEITGAAYPQLSGSFGINRNFNLPVTVLPDFISPSVYGVLDKEDVRDGGGNPIKWDGIVGTFPATFGVPWSANAGISVQQIIFQPDVVIGLKARNSALELYRNQLKVSEDAIKSNVYNTYYGVLVAEKSLAFTKASEDRLKALYKEQEEIYKNGFIEKLDLSKTLVNLNNVSTTVIQLNTLVQNSYAALKFALAIPQKDSLVLSDSLSITWVKEKLLSFEDGFTYENRSEVKTLLSSEKLLALQVKRYTWQSFPTVTAQWNLGTTAQRLKFDFFDTKQQWFFSNLLGLNIGVPIFDGFQRKSKKLQATYALEKNRNTLSQLKQSIDLQIIVNKGNLVDAINAFSSQEENVDLAKQVYSTTREKYQQGLGSSLELLQAETDLQRAYGNYYQSLYQATLARIAYLNALGKL